VKERKLINKFKAISEAGEEYTILEYQDFIDETVPGLKYLCTSSGLEVNFIAPGTFKIVDTDEIVRRI
jgi:hypothetical protein